MTPFDFVKSIKITNEWLWNDDTKDQYIPVLINAALSYHPDTVLQANEMNILNGLDNDIQYKFLINSIRKHKRPFNKWIRREKNEDLEAVMKYYDFSYRKAKEALQLLNDPQLNEIKQLINQGGLQ